MGHASKERVVLIGTDQRITSGPAATTAAFRGRIHGCTRTLRGNVQFFSLAPRAPSIQYLLRKFLLQQMAAVAELVAGMISARTMAALQSNGPAKR
jgi:hypothetical protein